MKFHVIVLMNGDLLKTELLLRAIPGECPVRRESWAQCTRDSSGQLRRMVDFMHPALWCRIAGLKCETDD